ncbi:MAG: hypothetical protein LBB21_00765 [Holosporaceae bacterium]|jgi:hypothetical protein|nr:hypothetical protein [Holosporaceae bacterium]
MTLVFDWSSSFYEEKKQWRGDEEIISLEIFQKECGFAVAKVSIGTKNADRLLDKKYVKIGMETQNGVKLIFSGRLIAFPVGFGSATTQLEFISEPDDYQEQLSKFSRKKFKEYQSVDNHSLCGDNILFDDLFFSSQDFSNPTIFLEGKNKIFYWDMKNGKLSLSDINRGRKNFDINGDEILQDSIKVRIAREPYSVVNLKVSASWVQHEYGIIDVLPMIAAKFDRNVINSLTNIKPAIENIFSEKNGYKLAYCNIREIKSQEISKNYPVISPDFGVQENPDAERKKVKFKRFYFDGKFILNWTYKQKRRENVSVKILNPSSPHGREKNLYLRLNAIQLPKKYPVWNHFTYYGCSDKILYKDSIFECVSPHISAEIFEHDKWMFVQKIPDALTDDMSSSFFATDRGKNAIKYAIQKAIALINYSSRHVEIDFCVEAKNFIFAGLDDQITINDGRFKNGYISGKITKMRFIGDADQKIIKFTIGCCVADLSDNFDRLNFYEIDVTEDENKINPADIVRKIEIKNTPEEQIEILSNENARNSSELQSVLKKHGTKIKISLHPLSTTRVVTREVRLPDIELN